MAAAASNRQVTFVQTNLDEAHADHAEQLAADLHARIAAETIVITLGRLGALARTATDIYRANAPPVGVCHTHGAGAAFSGGLAHAHLVGIPTAEAIQAACRVGSAHCEATDHSPHLRFDADLIKEYSP